MLYVLVHKNRVLVGPRDWNRAMFDGALRKIKVEALIPLRDPQTIPLEIDADTYITHAQDVIPDHDPMFESYVGPEYDYSNRSCVLANWFIKERDLGSIQTNMKTLAASVRYEKEVSSCTAVIQNVTVTLDTSRDGRNIFVQKLSLMGYDDTVNWKFPECWLTLSKGDLTECVTVGAQHIQAAFDWEKTISDQIDAATTITELKQIVIVEPPPPIISEPQL